MIEFFERIDTQVFLFLNAINNPFWDNVMWMISDTLVWLPLYLLCLFFVFKRFRWKGLITFVALILLILIADQGSVHLFKNIFQRLRPCHQPEIADLVHTVNGKCGGKFGFVSSHAANTFAFAMFMSLFFKSMAFTPGIFIWAAMVSYSRIYLGVHYPFDIIGGAFWGMITGYIMFEVHQWVQLRYFQKKSPVKGSG